MTTVTTTNTAAVAAAAQDGAKSKLNADFDMFLKLLTAQMQNQDPLDPMDASEYTQQLVQFSQVEQSMQQTTALNNILTQMNAQGMTQASAYIGREARFDSTVAALGDAPATWTYVVDGGAPQMLTMTVKDASGKVVRTQAIDAKDQGRFSWDGTKDDGSKATNGAYSLSVSAKDTAGGDMNVTVNSVGIVKEVVTDGSNVLLNVNGVRFSLDGLVAVSAPAASA